jgi:7-cyano-7-deazaguanine reductase
MPRRQCAGRAGKYSLWKYQIGRDNCADNKLPKITDDSDLDGLTLLGGKAGPVKKLEVFPNHHSERDYTVTLATSEFTCLCPMTGQPDFAKITIRYIPDKSIVESKSLKLYLASFRNEGAFHEHVANVILDDLVNAMAPRWCKVSAEFAVRGGIAITVDAEYRKPVAPATRSAPSNRPERMRTLDSGPRQTNGRDNYRSPSKRWEGERSGSRPDREKRQPAKEESRPEAEPRRSERRITKSPGETRVWRKRI